MNANQLRAPGAGYDISHGYRIRPNGRTRWVFWHLAPIAFGPVEHEMDIQIPNRYFYLSRMGDKNYHPVVAYLTDTGYEVRAWSDQLITIRGHDGQPVTYKFNRELTQAIRHMRSGRNVSGDVVAKLTVVIR